MLYACADSFAETKDIAEIHPDIINPEPSELIGSVGGKVSDMSYVMELINYIVAGSEAAGAAFGIMNADRPIAMIDKIIGSVRRAADDLKSDTEG